MTMLDDRPLDLDEPPVATLPMSFQARSGRWRTAARLARREMRRRPWRTVLSLLLIAVPVAAMVVADIAYRTDRLYPDTDLVLGSAEGVVNVSSPGADVDAVLAALPAGAESTVARTADLPLRSTAWPDELVDAVVHVRDPESPLHDGRVRVLDGRAPAAMGEVLLGPDLADEWDVGVGDQLALVHPAQAFTVVGIGYTSTFWGWAGEARGFVAPGFDLTLVQPERVSTEVLVAGAGLDPNVPLVVDATDPAAGAVVDPTLPLVDDATDGVASRAGSREYYMMSRAIYEDQWSRPEPGALFLGWLGAVMLLGVTGVLVAAAFAVSGRRQLVTIGQLSATGADPVVLRRYLALQGTVTGLVAALLGVAGGFVAVQPLRRFIETSDGRLAWSWFDIGVLVVTAVVIATIAAVVPTRSLATTSVLTALGGRRPVPAVRVRQVSIGAGLLGVGLVLVALSTAAAQTTGDEVITGAGAVLGALAVLIGVCCLCPLVIDQISRLGARGRGALRLATRGLGRHRSRSGALLASIVVVAAASMAASMASEDSIADNARWESELARQDPRIMQFRGTSTVEFDSLTGEVTMLDPEAALPELRERVTAALGPAEWLETPIVSIPPTPSMVEVEWYQTIHARVVDGEMLSLMGVPADVQADILEAGAASLAPTTQAWSGDWFWCCPETGSVDGLPEVRTFVVDGLRFGYGNLLVTADVATELIAADDVDASTVLIALLADEPSGAAVDGLRTELGGSNEAYAFVGVGTVGSALVEVSWMGPPEQTRYLFWVRLATTLGALLLMALIIAIGMALWAAEGRDERDTLVAVGAGPSVLSRIAAWKTLALTTTGSVLGLLLGWAVVRIVARAGNLGTIGVWWPFVLAAGIGVPAVITLGTWIASSSAQRLRPVTASTMSD